MLVVLLHESDLLSISILGVRWQRVWVECDPDAYLSLCVYLVLMTTTGLKEFVLVSQDHQLQGM